MKASDFEVWGEQHFVGDTDEVGEVGKLPSAFNRGVFAQHICGRFGRIRYSEDGSCTFLRNISIRQPNYTVSRFIKQ